MSLANRLNRMTPDEAAAFWIVRRERRSLTAEERALFDQWLETPRHAEAYAAMRDLHTRLAEIGARGAHRAYFTADGALLPASPQGTPS